MADRGAAHAGHAFARTNPDGAIAMFVHGFDEPKHGREMECTVVETIQAVLVITHEEFSRFGLDDRPNNCLVPWLWRAKGISLAIGMNAAEAFLATGPNAATAAGAHRPN